MLGKALQVLVIALSLFFTNHAYSFSEKNELLNAVEKGNLSMVKQLLKSGMSVNSKGFLGSTALMKAALKGNEEMVKLLLDFGADIYVKDDGGATPLHYAVRAGNSKIVELLVKSGADVNTKDKLGFSPLKRAALGKNEDIIALLSESKFQKNEESKTGDVAKIEDPTLQAMVSEKHLPTNSGKKYKSAAKQRRNFKNTLLNESDFLDEEVVKRADMKIEKGSIAPIQHEQIEVAELSKILLDQTDESQVPILLEEPKDKEIVEYRPELEEEPVAIAEVSDLRDLIGSVAQESKSAQQAMNEVEQKEELSDGIYVAEAQIIEDENDLYVPEPIPSNFKEKSEEMEPKKIEAVKQPATALKEKESTLKQSKPAVVQDLAAKSKALKEAESERVVAETNAPDEKKFKNFKISADSKTPEKFKFSIVMDGFKNLDLAFKFWDQLSNLKEFSSARISLSFKERNGKEELVVVASYFPSNSDAFAGCLRALRITSGFACRPSQEF